MRLVYPDELYMHVVDVRVREGAFALDDGGGDAGRRSKPAPRRVALGVRREGAVAEGRASDEGVEGIFDTEGPAQ